MIDLEFNSIVVQEHTLYDSNLLKYIDTCFMAQITVLYVFGNNICPTIVG